MLDIRASQHSCIVVVRPEVIAPQSNEICEFNLCHILMLLVLLLKKVLGADVSCTAFYWGGKSGVVLYIHCSIDITSTILGPFRLEFLCESPVAKRCWDAFSAEKHQHADTNKNNVDVVAYDNHSGG